MLKVVLICSATTFLLRKNKKIKKKRKEGESLSVCTTLLT